MIKISTSKSPATEKLNQHLRYVLCVLAIHEILKDTHSIVVLETERDRNLRENARIGFDLGFGDG